MSVAHLPHAYQWGAGNTNMYISFDVNSISRLLFQWPIESFVQWTLALVLIPPHLFSICLLAFTGTSIDDGIKMSWCISEHFTTTDSCLWPPSLHAFSEWLGYVERVFPGFTFWKALCTWAAGWEGGDWGQRTFKVYSPITRLQNRFVNHRHLK